MWVSSLAYFIPAEKRQAMPQDSHGSLALLVEGYPQAPFERRISFCGCAF